jgi:16S rRNA (cytidine1402-2'-O)-methyltransferase
MPKGEPLPAVERTLYVVATPIGNLRDITLRALDILAQADVVAAEDTRVTATLMTHYGFKARLLSLHQHNERARAAEIVALLAGGKRVAIVTDAGTPGISDPGAVLVREVAAAGYAVVPIPGASAATAALSAAGIASPHWLFYGFLPTAAKARKDALESLRMLPFALVFYEAPHRIAATMRDLAQFLGTERPGVVARELTKHYETIERGSLAELAARVEAATESQRGEFVVIVEAPPQRAAATAAEADDAVLTALLGELPLAQAVRIAVALTGSAKNRLYARALELQATSAQ